jgi:hypothetical protein
LLDDSTILQAVKSLPWKPDEQDEMFKLIELGQWAVSLPEEHVYPILDPDPQAPKWDEELFPSDLLEQIRQRFEKGERIAFRIPLTVELVSGEVKKTNFKIFLERDAKLVDGTDRYIRQGITLPEMRMIPGKPVRGLVVVEDGPLSTLLGDAENPSHSNWEERSTKIRDFYSKGPSRVRFVKNSLKFIVALLSRVTSARDENLLRDFFFVDIPKTDLTNGGVHSTPGKPDEQKSTKPIIDIQKQTQLFRVDYVTGGFRVLKQSTNEKSPARVQIEVAYDVRRGNPFASYEAWDFELDKSPIEIERQNCKDVEISRNKIAFSPTGSDFSVTVTGFDRKRDVTVRVQEIE